MTESRSSLQAALDIAEVAAHREEVICRIRTIRLEGMAAVRNADGDKDFAAVARPFIERLESIGHQ